MKLEIYQVKVLPQAKKLYFPTCLHEGIGYIRQEDDDHIWFRFFRHDSQVSYISSAIRYTKEDIEYTPIEKVWTIF